MLCTAVCGWQVVGVLPIAGVQALCVSWPHAHAPPPASNSPGPPPARGPLQGASMPRGAAHTQWGKVAEPSPLAVVERDERTKQVRAHACVPTIAARAGLLAL